MKLLLDTHVLLWWATLHRSLSPRARKAISSDEVDVYVSAATAWEIAIKVRIGKLAWPATAGTVGAYVRDQGFQALPISIDHAERAGQLAIDHRDPFDRMLIAQAQAEDMWLASKETLFDDASVRRYW